MKDALRRESVVDIQDDGDPYWFNNPQYRLSADEPAEVGVLLARLFRCVDTPYVLKVHTRHAQSGVVYCIP